MKKILLSALTLVSATVINAQSGFFTKTCYRGAFAPAPSQPWTDSWTNWDPQNTNYGAPTQTVNTNITSNTTWSGVIALQGQVYVKNNSVLTIQPGTIIRGIKNLGSALIVTKGSQLIANGTAASPIVFTSDQAAGSRASGDWGGIILLGKAAANYTSGVNNVEGLPVSSDTEFGGGTSPDDNDNSGSLRYVRIEFGGYPYQPNQEINSLTLGAVGRGTTLEFIQASFGFDDAFEWFGGTVNAKYLVSYRNLDDDFDTDNGYSGNVQFGLIVRDPNIADNPSVSTSEGFESDNNAGGTALTPLTSAIFSNITMVGPLRGASTNSVASGYRRAARIRRASNLRIFNSLFMDVQRGIHIDGSLCEAAATNGALKFKHNIVAGTSNGRITEVNSGSTFNAPAWFGTNANDSIVYSNPSFTNILTNPYNFTSPDYRPKAGSPALAGASFTDALLSSNTSTAVPNVTATFPATVCIGTNVAQLSSYTFAPNASVDAGYCSLNWSAPAGLSISSNTVVSPSFTVSTLGTFVATLTVLHGDAAKSVTTAITTNTCLDVFVNEIDNGIGRVSLYPNPSTDFSILNISAQKQSAVTITVYDLTGKIVLIPASNYNVNAGENTFGINSAVLPNGIYFVTLSSANGKETVKFVVNH